MMGQDSKIEWCRHTLNFWLGCTKLSPACEHCYAEGWAKRAGQPELWAGERRKTVWATWNQLPKWNAAAKAAERRDRVFVNSLSDFFDNQVPRRWRDDAWHFISRADALDMMLLTKRPENIEKMLPDPGIGAPMWGEGWPNVWIGTTVEDRARKRRIEALRAIPARIRFLSIEPLLEDLGELDLSGIQLVIVGGESGPGARPMDPIWVRPIRDQCDAAGVAFFFKQWGDWLPYGQEPDDFATGDLDDVAGGDTSFFRVGKAKAGRLLDGVVHVGMPS